MSLVNTYYYWEMFYTYSNKEKTIIEQVSIDVTCKRFVHDKNVDFKNLKGTCFQDITCVSNHIFDIIIKSLKADNFSQLIAK